MDGSALQLLVATSGFAFLALHAFRVLPSLVFGEVLPLLRRSWGAWRRYGGGCDAQLEATVTRRVRQWQLEQFRASVVFVSLIFMYVVAGLVCNALVGVNADVLSVGLPSRSPGRIVCIMLIYGCAVLMLLCPFSFTSRSLDIWFWLFIVPMIVFKSPLLCKDYQCDHFLAIERITMATFSVGRMDTTHTTIACLMWCCSTFLVWMASPEMLNLETTRHDFFAAMTTTIFAVYLHRRARAQVKDVLRLELLQQKQQAFRVLMKNFYDVVLELDADLRIVGPAQELAIFLLYGTGAALEGRPFQDFLTEEAREAVLAKLNLPLEGQKSITEVVHAHMRGVEGSRLEAEIFIYQFESLTGECDGSPCSIVGIREYGDEMHGVPKEGCTTELSTMAVSTAEMVVKVDTSVPRLTILEASASFELFVSDVWHDCGLCELVADRAGFGKWVQATMNARLQGVPADPTTSRFHVRFKPYRGIQTQALCSLGDMEDDFDDQDPTREFHARLVFREVERKRCRSLIPASSSPPSSLSSDRGRDRRTAPGSRASQPLTAAGPAAPYFSQVLARPRPGGIGLGFAKVQMAAMAL